MQRSCGRKICGKFKKEKVRRQRWLKQSEGGEVAGDEPLGVPSHRALLTVIGILYLTLSKTGHH